MLRCAKSIAVKKNKTEVLILDMKKPIIFVLAVLFLSACQEGAPATYTEPANTVIDAAARQRLDSTLQHFVDAGQVGGLSLVAWEKGREVYFGAVGFTDARDDLPMMRNSIAQIYSMTKPITGVALMQLYEQEKFELDDPVSQYIPELADLQVYKGVDENGQLITVPPARPMTVRDLTRHTAGFYNGGDTPALRTPWEAANLRRTEGMTLDQLVKDLATVPLLFHPGEQWEYGLSVDVQALLVQRLSGQPFDEYLSEHVLGPLGMRETRYFVPLADRSRMVASFRYEGDTLTQLPDAEAHAFNINPQTHTPGGWGLTSTLDDYLRFVRMLLNEGTLEEATILRPETVRLMATNHLSDTITQRLWLPSKGQVGFGIDFAVRLRPPASPEENPGEVGEFFWDGAASTLFWVDPKNELTVVLFAQLFPYDQIGLHREVRRAVYGKK